MGRFDPAGFTGEPLDGDVVAADAWAAAFDTADIVADYAGAFELPEIDLLDLEDDIAGLVARRPSRRLRPHS
jgi:hypothetical protein